MGTNVYLLHCALWHRGGLQKVTWSVQELALPHVSNIQPLQQQHQVAEVLLHHTWTVSLRHPLFIQGLGVQTQAQA